MYNGYLKIGNIEYKGTPFFLYIFLALLNVFKIHHGPVVQSIVSLMSLLRGQIIKCFMTS